MSRDAQANSPSRDGPQQSCSAMRRVTGLMGLMAEAGCHRACSDAAQQAGLASGVVSERGGRHCRALVCFHPGTSERPVGRLWTAAF